MKRRLAILGALFVLLAACGGAGGGDDTQLTGDWRLTGGTHDGNPLPIPPEAPITMTIADGQVSGRAACNTYGGEVTITGDELAFGAMSMTEMGCDPPIMEAESTYLAALATVTGWERTGNQLTLSGEGVELTYAFVPPVQDVGLVDTLWTLDGLIDGEAVSSTMGDEPATLLLADDGSITGSTGCREFTGTYELDGTSVTVRDLVTDDRACPDLVTQDEHVLAVLSDGFGYDIDGDRLTLSAGDVGLVYVAGTE